MNDAERLALRAELAAMRTSGARRQDLSQHACKRLFFDFGIRPSMATVRDLTQTGSASDIPKDIDAFWARIRSASPQRITRGCRVSAQFRTGDRIRIVAGTRTGHAKQPAGIDSSVGTGTC